MRPALYGARHYIENLSEGQQTTDNGQRTTDNRQRTIDNGQRTIDNVQQTFRDCNRASVLEHPRTDNGQQTTIVNYDIVGPICESSDIFAKDCPLPVTKRGDLLAIRSAGAYGETMASQYNCRELPKAYTTTDM